MDNAQNQGSEITLEPKSIRDEREVSSVLLQERSVLHSETTMELQKNRSEVAAFLQQWDLEMEAMQQGLHGIAMTARHDFILKRMSGLIDEQKVEALWLAMRQEQSASPAD